ncbi:MAG: CHASE domain-containing protein, partial [Burkholderiales bacterium]
MIPSERVRAARTWAPRFGLPLVVFLVGAMVSGLLYSAMLRAEQRATRAKFEAIAEDRFQAIEREIEAGLQALRSVGAFYAASQDVEREEFREFVTLLLAQARQVRAFEWVPLVAGKDRQACQEAARAAGWPQFRFTERGSSGALVEAQARQAHFPVFYVEPYAGNEAALGFDFASEPARLRALYAARDSGQIAGTEPLSLVGEVEGRSSIVVVLPVYRNRTGTDTIDERSANLTGFVAAALRAEDLVEKALARLTPQWVDLYMRDATDETNVRALYARASRLRIDRRVEPVENRRLDTAYTRAT